MEEDFAVMRGALHAMTSTLRALIVSHPDKDYLSNALLAEQEHGIAFLLATTNVEATLRAFQVTMDGMLRAAEPDPCAQTTPGE